MPEGDDLKDLFSKLKKQDKEPNLNYQRNKFRFNIWLKNYWPLLLVFLFVLYELVVFILRNMP